jgi:hypothetical protein
LDRRVATPAGRHSADEGVARQGGSRPGGHEAPKRSKACCAPRARGLAEDPNLAGTVTIQFTLVGEPKVGGLLERVQQLYALELDPPPDGVTVERELHLKVP